MNIFRKMVSLIVIVSFIFTTTVSDIAISQPVNLATASISNDIGGYALKDMGRIKVSLKAQMDEMFKDKGIPNARLLERVLKRRDTKEESKFQPADMQFFWDESGTVDPEEKNNSKADRYVQIRIKENGREATYYVVLGFNDEGYEIKGYYTEKVFEYCRDNTLPLPENTKEEIESVDRYVEHEVNLDRFLAERMKDNDAHLSFIKTEADWEYLFGASSSYFNLSSLVTQNLSDSSSVKSILSWLSSVPINFVSLKGEAYPKITVKGSDGKTEQVSVKSHVSNNGIYIILNEAEYENIRLAINAKEKGLNLDERYADTLEEIRDRILYEVGVKCGLEERFEYDPDLGQAFLINDLLEYKRMSENILTNSRYLHEWDNLKQKLKGIKPIDLDLNLLTRDYARGFVSGKYNGTDRLNRLAGNMFISTFFGLAIPSSIVALSLPFIKTQHGQFGLVGTIVVLSIALPLLIVFKHISSLHKERIKEKEKNKRRRQQLEVKSAVSKQDDKGLKYEEQLERAKEAAAKLISDYKLDAKAARIIALEISFIEKDMFEFSGRGEYGYRDACNFEKDPIMYLSIVGSTGNTQVAEIIKQIERFKELPRDENGKFAFKLPGSPDAALYLFGEYPSKFITGTFTNEDHKWATDNYAKDNGTDEISERTRQRDRKILIERGYLKRLSPGVFELTNEGVMKALALKEDEEDGEALQEVKDVLESNNILIEILEGARRLLWEIEADLETFNVSEVTSFKNRLLTINDLNVLSELAQELVPDLSTKHDLDREHIFIEVGDAIYERIHDVERGIKKSEVSKEKKNAIKGVVAFFDISKQHEDDEVSGMFMDSFSSKELLDAVNVMKKTHKELGLDFISDKGSVALRQIVEILGSLVDDEFFRRDKGKYVLTEWGMEEIIEMHNSEKLFRAADMLSTGINVHDNTVFVEELIYDSGDSLVPMDARLIGLSSLVNYGEWKDLLAHEQETRKEEMLEELMFLIWDTSKNPTDARDVALNAVKVFKESRGEDFEDGKSVNKDGEGKFSFVAGKNPEDAFRLIAFSDHLVSLSSYNRFFDVSKYRKYYDAEHQILDFKSSSSESQARRDLNGLVEKGLLKKEKRGNKFWYSPTKEGMEKIINMRLEKLANIREAAPRMEASFFVLQYLEIAEMSGILGHELQAEEAIMALTEIEDSVYRDKTSERTRHRVIEGLLEANKIEVSLNMAEKFAQFSDNRNMWYVDTYIMAANKYLKLGQSRPAEELFEKALKVAVDVGNSEEYGKGWKNAFELLSKVVKGMLAAGLLARGEEVLDEMYEKCMPHITDSNEYNVLIELYAGLVDRKRLAGTREGIDTNIDKVDSIIAANGENNLLMNRLLAIELVAENISEERALDLYEQLLKDNVFENGYKEIIAITESIVKSDLSALCLDFAHNIKNETLRSIYMHILQEKVLIDNPEDIKGVFRINEVSKMKEIADQAGRDITTHAKDRYTLFVTGEFFVNGDKDKLQEKYKNRFNLHEIPLIPGSDENTYIDELIYYVGKKNNDEFSKTALLISDQLSQESLQRLTDKGLVYILVDTKKLIEGKADTIRNKKPGGDVLEEWQKFQDNTFSIMLLARSVANGNKTPSIMSVLRFYLKTHFNLKEVDIDGYVNAIENGKVADLVKGLLRLLPMEAYNMPEYHNVAQVLLSA